MPISRVLERATREPDWRLAIDERLSTEGESLGFDGFCTQPSRKHMIPQVARYLFRDGG